MPISTISAGACTILGPARYRRLALVAFRSRGGLADARETHPALYHSGNRSSKIDLGHRIARDESTSAEAAALVRAPRSPSGAGTWRPLGSAAFLSQGALVRSPPHLRCPHRTTRDGLALKSDRRRMTSAE